MKFDYAHILSYVERKLSIEELREYDALMKSSPRFRQEVERIKSISNLSDSLREQKKIDAEKAWLRLTKKIKLFSLRSTIWNYGRTAAAILLPLFLLHQFVIQPVLTRSSDDMITLYSAPGIITKVELPDGSEVWLNAQSELTYPAQFAKKERTVQLSGEAYFKVIADDRNSFNVETPKGVTVRALGTEFNVNAFLNESDYQITLASGKVEVGVSSSIKKELLVGQKAVVIPSEGSVTVIPADTYVETAWKDGKMVFRRQKLEIIAHKLSRKFGVVINLEGEALNDYEYTATFTDETLEDILDLLKRSAPITYSISRQEQLDNNAYSQRVVTIKSNK